VQGDESFLFFLRFCLPVVVLFALLLGLFLLSLGCCFCSFMICMVLFLFLGAVDERCWMGIVHNHACWCFARFAVHVPAI